MYQLPQCRMAACTAGTTPQPPKAMNRDALKGLKRLAWKKDIRDTQVVAAPADQSASVMKLPMHNGAEQEPRMHVRVIAVLMLGLVDKPRRLYRLAAEALPGRPKQCRVGRELPQASRAWSEPGHEGASNNALWCVMPVTGRHCGDEVEDWHVACGK